MYFLDSVSLTAFICLSLGSLLLLASKRCQWEYGTATDEVQQNRWIRWQGRCAFAAAFFFLMAACSFLATSAFCTT